MFEYRTLKSHLKIHYLFYLTIKEEIKLSEKETLLFDNEYVIMSEVADKETVTQRELSKKLGISVSTVNVLMNKMIREGLIKMTQVSQKQVLYMLTPVGLMEKGKKTVSYLKAHYRAIYGTKEKIKSIIDKLGKKHDIIYVLILDDEMSGILTIAVDEYKSNHSNSKQGQTTSHLSYVEPKIKIIHSSIDIDEKKYKSPILLHMTENEEIIDMYGDIDNLEIVNMTERL